MRAIIVGAGMGGLMTALALRQSGVFASVDVYEQTKVPSTAGAGLNIPPNGARIARWLGVDLDGVLDTCRGDPRRSGDRHRHRHGRRHTGQRRGPGRLPGRQLRLSAAPRRIRASWLPRGSDPMASEGSGSRPCASEGFGSHGLRPLGFEGLST